MDETRALALLIGEGVEHAINMVRGARAPLHGEAIGLVQHHEPLVLEEHHLLDGAGVVLAIGALHRPLDGRLHPQGRHAHQRGFREARIALHALAIHPHFALAQDLVEIGQAHRRKVQLEPAVKPHPLLVGGYDTRLHAG